MNGDIKNDVFPQRNRNSPYPEANLEFKKMGLYIFLYLFDKNGKQVLVKSFTDQEQGALQKLLQHLKT